MVQPQHIGYREYLFGFSEILDYYRTNKNLPLPYVFDSSVFYSQLIKEVYYKNGINEKIMKKMFPNI